MEYQELLAAILKAKNNYCVYMLVNHTKKAIYFGVTNNFQLRLYAHLNNAVKATKYWSTSDKIEYIIKNNLDKKTASSIAHSCEKMDLSKNFPGYTVIQTSGI